LLLPKILHNVLPLTPLELFTKKLISEPSNALLYFVILSLTPFHFSKYYFMLSINCIDHIILHLKY
ncbi:hypothetical protein HMPREF9088_2401, partial [Enterococcus italicus DSM 15952]